MRADASAGPPGATPTIRRIGRSGHAAQAGAIDEHRVVRETLGGIKRAGADLILTYFAMDIAREGF